ncbi:MAG: Spx/MgsR family RNA polymerase-binding regulatory protein [Bdellovibrionota bacterium]
MKLYGYKKCSSCRDAEKVLLAHKIPYEFIDITENPPSAVELKSIVKNSGLELKKFLNTSGEVYRSMGLKDKLKNYSDDELIKLLATNGRLIKRPLLVDKTKVTVGASVEVMKTWTL